MLIDGRVGGAGMDVRKRMVGERGAGEGGRVRRE